MRDASISLLVSVCVCCYRYVITWQCCDWLMSVGYKLAFNYLKVKRYVDAIDVCHQVRD